MCRRRVAPKSIRLLYASPAEINDEERSNLGMERMDDDTIPRFGEYNSAFTLSFPTSYKEYENIDVRRDRIYTPDMFITLGIRLDLEQRV